MHIIVFYGLYLCSPTVGDCQLQILNNQGDEAVFEHQSECDRVLKLVERPTRKARGTRAALSTTTIPRPAQGNLFPRCL